jgi:hypothetical protein
MRSVMTRYILAVLSAVFLALAAGQMARGRGPAHPQTRTWLLVGVIFAVVSGWLFLLR